MLVEVIRIRECLRVFIPVFWVIRNIATYHLYDGTIEALNFVVLLWVIRWDEGVLRSYDTACVLVELTGKLRTFIGKDFFGAP